MRERIVEQEFSVRISVGDTDVLFDPYYDHIHLFRWLGHSIIKVIAEDGLAQIHTDIAHAEDLAERSQCEPLEREKIGRREYNMYLKYQEEALGDHWLEE